MPVARSLGWSGGAVARSEERSDAIVGDADGDRYRKISGSRSDRASAEQRKPCEHDDRGEPARLSSEIGSLARQFLFDFSDSGIRDVGYILRNFSDRCPDGKASEANDVAFNRQHFIINSSSIGSASVSVDFAGTCPLRLRRADACALVPADWAFDILDDRSRAHVIGTDQVTAVYDPSRQRWGLCDSDFDGHNATLSSLRGFIR
jgi:hypothetical protein